MKKLIIVLLIGFSISPIFSQDLIVTKEGDSINCKDIRFKGEEKLYFHISTRIRNSKKLQKKYMSYNYEYSIALQEVEKYYRDGIMINIPASKRKIELLNKNELSNYIFGKNSSEIKVELDNNNNLVFTKIIDSLYLDKESIYGKALSFFVYNYSDGKSVIQVKNIDAGIIIGKGFYSNLNERTCLSDDENGFQHLIKHKYDAYHILQVDIKNNKARVKLTVSNYEYTKDINISKNYYGVPIQEGSSFKVEKDISKCAPLKISNPDTINIYQRYLADKMPIKKWEKEKDNYIEKITNEDLCLKMSEIEAFDEVCRRCIMTMSSIENKLKESASDKDDW